MYFRGLEVPKLGSSRDRIFRQYLTHELRVEAKKHEMLMLSTMMQAPPNIDPANKRAWTDAVRKSFDSYIALSINADDMPIEEPEEVRMKDFYAKHVKDTKMVVRKSRKGEGLEAFGIRKIENS